MTYPPGSTSQRFSSTTCGLTIIVRPRKLWQLSLQQVYSVICGSWYVYRRLDSIKVLVLALADLSLRTFTAARVKQEIAKEGILPFSLFFATSYRTPYGLWQQWRSKTPLPDEEVEQAPTAAFGLHWFTSVLQIAVTSAIVDPRTTYSILVSLYTYTIILVLGCWVSVGLLLTKMRKKFDWQETRRYRPWLSPVHAITYATTTAFMLVAAFVPTKRGSPYDQSVTGFPWWIVPVIGITAPLWVSSYLIEVRLSHWLIFCRVFCTIGRSCSTKRRSKAESS